LKALKKITNISSIQEVINYDFETNYDKYIVVPSNIQGSVRIATGKIADNNYIENKRKKVLSLNLLKI
jgi:hypothetical protein